MIMELREVPAAGTEVEIEACGLVKMWAGGEEIQFWLSAASDGELRRLLAHFMGRIYGLAKQRNEIFGQIQTINGELDKRTNERACIG